MGLFISLRRPTVGMYDTADHSGTYIDPVNGKTYPRVQIITVEELLSGQRPRLPVALLPYF
jgi:hypothetical protein